MKSLHLKSFLLLTFIALASCSSSYKFSLQTPKKAYFEDQFEVSLIIENNNPIEQATFFINGKEIPHSNNNITFKTKDFGVGKHQISVIIAFEGTSKRINQTVEVFPNNQPVSYDFEIVNTYPHDKEAYTQGLEYHEGYLYESTGRNGHSSIRKVDLTTGKVLQKVDIDKKYFGEGMTIFNNKIYFLTWQAKKGFVYDLETFKKEGEFNYGRSKEGWGLSHTEKELIKSDGSHKIWFLNPETQKETRFIQAYYNKGKIGELNEIEYIDGKIYANRWFPNDAVKSTAVVIINAENGIVEGFVSLKKLRDHILKTQKLEDDDVLNGIAYDTKNNRLFVTGKNWGKLFEIKLIKK